MQLTKPEKIPTELLSITKAYLMAEARAQTIRLDVDRIHREILTECPIYIDKLTRSDRQGEQILQSKDLYLSTDKALCNDFYAEAHKRCIAAGYKEIEDKEIGYCPALMAEDLSRVLQRQLVKIAIDSLNIPIEFDSLRYRLEHYKKFTDLILRLVCTMEDLNYNKVMKGAA